MKSVLVVQGPNLNMLGKRDSSIYGAKTLNELHQMIEEKADKLNIKCDFYQSNSEGEIVDTLNNALHYDALIINPAAYTHYSIAIRDALEILDVYKVEVHLSNIYEREDFRKVNVIKDVVNASIIGKGPNGYIEALELINNIDKLNK